MLQSTVDRLGHLVPPERTWIITGAKLMDEVWNQLPQLAPQSIFGEPCRRDTAPCIGLAALSIARDDPDAIMAVMPSDHVISPDAAFQRRNRSWPAGWSNRSPRRIVTFGIRPTYPAESFGYIERGEAVSSNAKEAHDSAAGGTLGVYHVRQFREKPKADVAKQYLSTGRFYWNSGIFAWKAATIIEASKSVSRGWLRICERSWRRSTARTFTMCLSANSPRSRACRSTMR